MQRVHIRTELPSCMPLLMVGYVVCVLGTTTFTDDAVGDGVAQHADAPPAHTHTHTKKEVLLTSSPFLHPCCMSHHSKKAKKSIWENGRGRIAFPSSSSSLSSYAYACITITRRASVIPSRVASLAFFFFVKKDSLKEFGSKFLILWSCNN